MLVHQIEAIDKLLEAAISGEDLGQPVADFQSVETQIETTPEPNRVKEELQKDTFGFFTTWVINHSL